MTLDCFRESIMRSDEVLRPFGISLSDLLMDSNENGLNDTVNAFLSVIGVQVIIHVSDFWNIILQETSDGQKLTEKLLTNSLTKNS